MKRQKPTFTLRLEALPLDEGRDPDGTLRLRAVLKRLLRSYSMKCVDARRVANDKTTEPGGPARKSRSAPASQDTQSNA